MKSFEKLKTKLAELFQLDQADLDFGIYRIMNARRDEINLFLEKNLLPQVREAFGEYKSSDKAKIQEEDVYDHLYSFFSRYYDEGDFISLRRYKEGVYAIPYEGEEVKLHWANHDSTILRRLNTSATMPLKPQSIAYISRSPRPTPRRTISRQRAATTSAFCCTATSLWPRKTTN